MIEHVVFRCQLLPVLVECRPSSPDSILDFGRLRNAIVWPKYLTLSPLVSISIILSSTSISFFCVRASAALVAENFRLFWVDPETHFFSNSLEFAQNLMKLFFRGCEQKHVVGKPQVREAVMVVVTQVDSHSFFLLQALDVVFQ